MADWHTPQGPFDIPDVVGFIPRRLKPWLFVFFVLIIQFSGGLYLAAAVNMVGSTALMQEDILMAGYASLIGMSINFAVMFRVKFRFSARTQLLISASVLIAANFICTTTTCVPVMVLTCFIAGWFRMQATFACNSTIQLWITPKRDMAIFFCYVYIIVDSVIQLSGIATIYSSLAGHWEYMQWIMTAMLVLMMLLVAVLLRPVRGPMYIPLLGIDWLGAALWSVVMVCFTYVCVYGNYYDWWESTQICASSLIGLSALSVNLWRATFLHHPYISIKAMTNRNVIRATAIYLVFFTILATEHVVEHGYAESILGFDNKNIIDLNWYVLCGIILGCIFAYYTFARLRWRYKTMTAIGFTLASCYLAYFYFNIDYCVEKEMLIFPLMARGAASVIISIVFLTSIVQSGLPFKTFPQALTINGFTGAVMGAALGPAIIGELLRHIMASKVMHLSESITSSTTAVDNNITEIYGFIHRQALLEAQKDVYGWLLMVSLVFLTVIIVSYSPVKPLALFPSWKTVRRTLVKISRYKY